MNAARKLPSADERRIKAIRDFVQLDEDTQKLISGALADLYNGPSGTDDDYPGFMKATGAIARVMREIGDVWFDMQSEFVTSVEPVWCDGECGGDCVHEYPGDWYRIEKFDVIRILVGRELAPYVR